VGKKGEGPCLEFGKKKMSSGISQARVPSAKNPVESQRALDRSWISGLPQGLDFLPSFALPRTLGIPCYPFFALPSPLSTCVFPSLSVSVSTLLRRQKFPARRSRFSDFRGQPTEVFFFPTCFDPPRFVPSAYPYVCPCFSLHEYLSLPRIFLDPPRTILQKLTG